MKKGFIVLAIVAIIALYILNKVNTARQLEFSVGTPREVSLKGGALTFQLPLTAANVTSGSIRVKAIDMDVYTAGKYIGKATMSTPVTIVPAANTTLLVNVRIEYFDLLTAAGSIVNVFKSGAVSLKLDGLVYAEGFQVPVVQTFDFTIPKL